MHYTILQILRSQSDLRVSLIGLPTKTEAQKRLEELKTILHLTNLNIGINIIRDLASGYFVLNQGTHFKFGQGNIDDWSIDIRLIQASDSITDR